MSEDRSGRVEAIWIKRGRKGPMEAVETVQVVAEEGIVENANQGGRRQVTLLSREAWGRALDELGAHVDPIRRRANVLVSGLDLEQSRDRVVRLGNIRIRVEGETRPCHVMDEAHAGLRVALDPEWRGGAYGVVLDDGSFAVGDEAAWQESAS